MVVQNDLVNFSLVNIIMNMSGQLSEALRLG